MRTVLLMLCLLAVFASIQPAHAASLSAGDLIKASGPSVYYYGADLKRYVFPNEKTYRTWYSDFSLVKTISDAELASIMIGGNVTYRPAIRLVKVATDPKVYAVAQGGALRWVPDEATARSLYGNDWARSVDDLPDAFFVNYRLSDPISVSAPFVPQTEAARSPDINTDKQLYVWPITNPLPPTSPATSTPPTGSTSTPPTSASSTPVTPSTSTASYLNTPGYSGTLQILNDNGQLVSGARLNLLASSAPSGGIQSIKLFSNDRLIQTCTDSPCNVLFSTDVSSSAQTQALRAEFVWLGGARAYATSHLILAPNTTSQSITLTVPSEVLPRQNYVISAVVNNQFDARQTTIYLDNVAVYYCRSVQQCEYQVQAGTATGTQHRVHVMAENNFGTQIQSETKTLALVSNAHPTVRIAPNTTILARGARVIVEATGYDNEGIAFSEILLDGTVLKRCNASSCQVMAGPWNEARSLSFTGHVQDLAGLDGYATSTPVTVQ